MKKVIVFVGFLLFCAQIVHAQQSPCEKTFDSAKQFFAEKRYDEAKEQFYKVVKNCDFNKETAQEYIKLCEGFLRLKDSERKAKEQNNIVLSVSDDEARRIKELEDRISYLQADSTQRATTINTYAEKMLAKNNTIDSLKEIAKQSVDLTNRFENEREAFYGSLRDLGIELNVYLEEKLNNKNKMKIEDVDTVSNDSLVIVLKRNVKLVNEIKAITWF